MKLVSEDVSAPDDADDEEECQISCLYVGIAHVESKSKESGLLCSYDVISDVDIEIGDVFQHVIDVPKTFKSQQGDDGRILVKKVRKSSKILDINCFFYNSDFSITSSLQNG